MVSDTLQKPISDERKNPQHSMQSEHSSFSFHNEKTVGIQSLFQ